VLISVLSLQATICILGHRQVRRCQQDIMWLASLIVALVATLFGCAAASIWGRTGPGFPVRMLGCNADSTHQVPGHPDYFVSRLGITLDSKGSRQPTPGDFGCNWTYMRLVLAKMDWGTHSLEYVATLLDANTGQDPVNSFPTTPIQNGKYVLQSAYDPTVMAFNGELWVAFECWGSGMGSVSSCVGPLSTATPAANSVIDLSRTTVLIEGAATPGAGYAASVPKVFVHDGRPYLYYDAFLTGPGSLAQRGVPLEVVGGRMWVKGAGAASYSILDPLALTVEVWAKNHDDLLSNNIADVFNVIVDGPFVFATAGVGGCAGGTCSAPGDNMGLKGCYRLALGRSNFPLGPFDYVLNAINSSTLPANSHEYAKVIVDPSFNATNIYGQFLASRSPPGFPLPAGFQAIPLPWATAAGPSAQQVVGFFGGRPGPCRADQRPPNWGERAGVCRPSCGGLGGSASFVDACYTHGLEDAGVAYDVPFCCGAPAACGDARHRLPDWGVRDGVCLKSCGGLGGTKGSDSACARMNMLDAGRAYDAPYCCYDPPCPQRRPQAGFS